MGQFPLVGCCPLSRIVKLPVLPPRSHQPHRGSCRLGWVGGNGSFFPIPGELALSPSQLLGKMENWKTTGVYTRTSRARKCPHRQLLIMKASCLSTA